MTQMVHLVFIQWLQLKQTVGDRVTAGRLSHNKNSDPTIFGITSWYIYSIKIGSKKRIGQTYRPQLYNVPEQKCLNTNFVVLTEI